MNVGRPSDEKLSDQTSYWSDKLAVNSGHEVRCYRCSFCKRGFSNAQALGGHMNIHRKDRAKLKEFSDENLLTLDISGAADFCGETSLNGELTTRKMGVDHGKVDDHGVVGVSSDENSTFGLSLFAEGPSLIGGEDKGLEKRGMELLIHGGQVDLELRLGYEPHDAKIG